MRSLRSHVSCFVLVLLLTSTLAVALKIQPVSASGTIYIRGDGSIDPSEAPISTLDNVTYKLTGNITSDVGARALKLLVEGVRKYQNNPALWEHFEYYYNEMKKYEQKLQQSKA